MSKYRVHFAPADDGSQTGDGTAAHPFRIGRQDFDDMLRVTVRKKGVEEIFLHPGRYYTRGAWAHKEYTHTARPFSIRGSSRCETTIALDTDDVEWHSWDAQAKQVKERDDTMVLVMGPDSNNGPSLVTDLTIDPQAHSLPSGKLVTAGICMYANGGVIGRVDILPLKGSLSRNQEAFGIITRNRPNGEWPTLPNVYGDGGLRIHQVSVYDLSDDDDAYTSGIHIGHLESQGRVLVPTLVTDCQVIGIGAMPCRVGLAGGSRVTFRDIYMRHVRYPCYNDNGHMSDVMFESLTVDDAGYIAMGLHRVDDGYPGWKRNITLRDSTFRYTPRGPKFEWGALTLWDKTVAQSGLFDNIQMYGNVFQGPANPQQQFFAVSIDAKNVRRLGDISDNVFPDDTAAHVTPQSESLQTKFVFPAYKYRIPTATK